MAKMALKVGGAVFLLVFLLHLARLVFRFDLVIAGAVVPVWVNGVGSLVTLALSVWMFRAARSLTA